MDRYLWHDGEKYIIIPLAEAGCRWRCVGLIDREDDSKVYLRNPYAKFGASLLWDLEMFRADAVPIKDIMEVER